MFVPVGDVQPHSHLASKGWRPPFERLGRAGQLREAAEAGDISDRETPVPIPNTAVKPIRADVTSAQFGAGKVGRCRPRQPLED
jgi:hypothetical protein